jgi:hypothetical protein
MKADFRLMVLGCATAALLSACYPGAGVDRPPAPAALAASQAEEQATALAAKEAEEVRKRDAAQEESRQLVLGMNGVWKYITSGEVLIISSNKVGVNISVAGRIFTTTLDSVDNDNGMVNLATSVPTQGDIITLKKIPASDGKTYHISAAMPNGGVFELSFIRRLTNADIAKASNTGAALTLAASLPKEEVVKPDLQLENTAVKHQEEHVEPAKPTF